jgi:hypothetical protein
VAEKRKRRGFLSALPEKAQLGRLAGAAKKVSKRRKTLKKRGFFDASCSRAQVGNTREEHRLS